MLVRICVLAGKLAERNVRDKCDFPAEHKCTPKPHHAVPLRVDPRELSSGLETQN